jgi:hypothetical protein
VKELVLEELAVVEVVLLAKEKEAVKGLVLGLAKGKEAVKGLILEELVVVEVVLLVQRK